MGKSIQLPDALLIIFAEDPEVVEIDVAFYNQEVGLTSFLTIPKGTRAVCSRSRSIQILCRSWRVQAQVEQYFAEFDASWGQPLSVN
jgi:hypothetical protein